MHPERSARLAELVRHLPFDVGDFEAARDVFVRWQDTGDRADRRTAFLWAYCYVVWYFYGKFARERTSGPSDLDQIVEEATRRVYDAMNAEAIREPERFPQFVSVVCKNLLRSHRERRRETVEVEDAMIPVTSGGGGGLDRLLARRLILRAVAALSPALAEVARMRLLEGKGYAEIGEETGHPLPTARAYYSKAIAQLRADPDLRALYVGESPQSRPRPGAETGDSGPKPQAVGSSGDGAGSDPSKNPAQKVRSDDPAGLRP